MSIFQAINPYTEKHLHQFHYIGHQALEEVLSKSDLVFKQWKLKGFEERSILFIQLAKLIRQNQQELAALAVSEMGKPIKEAIAEVLKCTTACEYYATKSIEILKDQHSIADTGRSVTIIHEPMGVVLGIFPWNFPYWQIIRSAVPIVMAGNTVLIKPAPNVPKCALAIQELFKEAGFPEGVFQTIFADEKQIAELIADERIKACTLTGSEKAGSAVASQSGRFIKKAVLELGGSDPFIVMQDADLELAADTAIAARFQNNGQSCIASKRFILHQDIANQFTDKLIERVSKLIIGDPTDETVNMGPMARKDLRDKLKQQLDDSVRKGAKIIYQHPKEFDQGYFFPPTLLTNISKDSPAYREELFGPVLSVFIASSEDDAIRIANDTVFGLGASLWSTNMETAERISRQLECGIVFINGLVKSHAHYPFGGAKHSGVGRELGEWGIREFCNVKTVWR
jgi:succinate-semialdehyde dehydrogenase/glutarate-semialdehyde dehydrogenase